MPWRRPSDTPCGRRNTCTVVQLTLAGDASEDGRMSEATYVASRRSGRVFHKMRVKAQGRDHDGRKFREVCETLVVNSHGGLLLLKHEIEQGEMLVLTNPDTDEELECRVVFLGDAGDKGQRVGVEFLSPSPRFWGLEFVETSSAN
jgi:hypothetical protein